MKIVVECYGASQKWCGAAERSMEVGLAATVADVLDELAKWFPEFAARRATVAVAIGEEIVRTSTALSEGTRLALIPPVSGG
jgi:molybdopterin converting factor small subunit